MTIPLLLLALAPSAAEPPLRIVVIAASQAERQVLEESFRSLVPDAVTDWQPGPLDPRAVLTAKPANHDAPSLRAWIDLGRRGTAQVYLADPAGRRFAARTIPVDRLDAVAGETLAQVIRAGASALLDPGQPALSATEIAARLGPATPPPPAPEPAPPRSRQWEAVAAYAGRLASSSVDWAHGFAVAAAVLARSSGQRPFLWGSAARTRATLGGVLPVGAVLTPWSFRAGVGLELWPDAPVRVRLEAGAGMDAIEVAPRTTASEGASLEVAQTQTVSFAVGTLGVGVAVPLGPRLLARAAIAAEVSPRLRLQVNDRSQSRQVVAMGPLRGAALGGFGWRF